MPDSAAVPEADRRLDFHPAMGEQWEITRSTADTSGEVFEATVGSILGCRGLPLMCIRVARRAWR